MFRDKLWESWLTCEPPGRNVSYVNGIETFDEALLMQSGESVASSVQIMVPIIQNDKDLLPGQHISGFVQCFC